MWLKKGLTSVAAGQKFLKAHKKSSDAQKVESQYSALSPLPGHLLCVYIEDCKADRMLTYYWEGAVNSNELNHYSEIGSTVEAVNYCSSWLKEVEIVMSSAHLFTGPKKLHDLLQWFPTSTETQPKEKNMQHVLVQCNYAMKPYLEFNFKNR